MSHLRDKSIAIYRDNAKRVSPWVFFDVLFNLQILYIFPCQALGPECVSIFNQQITTFRGSLANICQRGWHQSVPDAFSVMWFLSPIFITFTIHVFIFFDRDCKIYFDCMHMHAVFELNDKESALIYVIRHSKLVYLESPHFYPKSNIQLQ